MAEDRPFAEAVRNGPQRETPSLIRARGLEFATLPTMLPARRAG